MNKLYLIIGLLIISCNTAFATLCTGIIPYSTTGQVTSVNLNNNLTACQGTINGLLDNSNANISAGYRFYQTVSSLPAAGNQGAVYFLTSDNSLNFDTGSTFIKQIGATGSPSQGNVLIYGASGLTYTGVGTSGQPLISQGAGSNATFGNISAVGSVSGAAFNSLSSTPSGAGILPSANVGGLLGSWQTKSVTTVYQASTDGFVVAYGSTTSSSATFSGITDSISTPTTVRQQTGIGSATSGLVSFCMPVRKNDYYEVTVSNVNATAIYFLSMGS